MSDMLSEKSSASYQRRSQASRKQKVDQAVVHSNGASTNDLLAESEQRFLAVWDFASDAMALSTPDGTLFAANSAYYDLFGFTPQEVIGQNFSRIFPEDQQQWAQEQYRTIFEREEIVPAFEEVVQRADGTRRTVESRYNFILHGGKRTAMLSIVRDITERKRLEEAVRQSKQQLEVVLENIADGVCVQDSSGTIVYMNEAGAKLCGYTSAAQLMQTPDLQTREAYTMQRFAVRDERGNPFPLEEMPGSRALRGEETPQAIMHYEDNVLGTRRWALVKARPIWNEDGQVQLAVTVFSEITEAHEAEKRKDEFIGMASHELKTPITTLKGLTQLLKIKMEKQGLAEPVHSLSRMENQINRLTRLVNELLDVSKIQAGKVDYAEERIALDALLRDIVETEQLITTTHTIALHEAPGVYVLGDRDRLGQVFLNLLSNAIKYSPGAERVDIFIATVENTVTVGVRDYGVGIPAEDQAKIFDRFYRVSYEKKNAFPGLGMGLYISWEIVNRHGGTLTVESSPGNGSTFSVTLPQIR